MRYIYLDYNATTPVSPPVREAMVPFLEEFYGNPSSQHPPGRACHEAVEDARGQVASLLGADREEIVFTSGGTEANNLALKGLLDPGAAEKNGHLIISAIEHPAIEVPAAYLERCGYAVTVVECDEQGVVSAAAVESALRPDTRLVSIMHANNEIGTIQPLREITEVCHTRGVRVHTDAAQSAGKIRVVVDELGVDLLSIAGHKLYAPKGVGALYVREGVELEPCLHGAGHESGLRPGTENVASIVALGKACMMAAGDLDDASDRMAQLRDRLVARLREAVGETLRVHGERAPRLPNTLSVNFPDVAGGALLAAVPEICASTGAACHAEENVVSGTLAALGLPAKHAAGTIRLSVGRYTQEEDVDRAAGLLIDGWERLRS